MLLIAIATAGFFLTRAIAADNRETTLRDAARLFEQGERVLAAGDTADAVAAFRHAVVKNRQEKRYALALALALASEGQGDAARRALIALRDAAPDDRDVNLQLARLAADRADVTEAIRYYHNTLYAPWPVDEAAARRSVRLELIRFLLTHDQSNRAEAELVALTADLPDDPATHVEAGRLFERAGDNARALDQFKHALRVTPDDADALAGAGLAAFRTGDYLLAAKYLRIAPQDDQDVKDAKELVELVLSNDPLAPRLGSPRRHRVAQDLSYAAGRLNACLEHGTRDGAADSLAEEVAAFERRLRRAGTADADTIETGVELAARAAGQAAEWCPPATPFDRALILIAQRHGAGPR